MPTATPDEHDPRATEPDPNPVRALFVVWRRVVAAVAATSVKLGRGAVTLARLWLRQWVRAAEYHRSADMTWGADGDRARTSAAAIGVRAFIAGLVLAGVAAAQQHGAVIAGVSTVLIEMLWAGARFIILALLMPRGEIDRSRLSIAYLAGLAPYLFGTTAVLRMLSLAASAYLTWRGVRGAGVTRADADRSVLWAFGGQAGAIALGWAIRALLALVVAL